MTAVVAIMNKTGVALAADSAVTVSNGISEGNVYNTANKLFALSKFHPIGIMIYNNSNLISTPWEIIIKLYKKKLHDKAFDTVEEYCKDFLDFTLSSPLINVVSQEFEFIKSIADKIITRILKSQNLSYVDEDEAILFITNKIKEIENLFSEEVPTNSNEQTKNDEPLSGEEVPTVSDEQIKNDEFLFNEDVRNYIKNKVNQILILTTNVQDLSKIELLFQQFEKLIFMYLNQSKTTLLPSGLVFAGYGESQIFPAIYSIELEGLWNQQLRYKVTENKVISHSFEDASGLFSFAQTDVMDTFLKGFDDRILNFILSSLAKSINESLDVYNQGILSANPNAINLTNIQQLKDIAVNQIVYNLHNNIEQVIQQIQTLPTHNALNILSKEDLADLAESLIYLTFLKRRTSLSQESVGGDIDVAIISKGDGFIWKKRKHYFDKELNMGFFQNYFK